MEFFLKIVNKTLLYSAEDIQRRVAEIAAEINAEYAGKDLVVVCVLKGGFMFFSDLVKQITVDPRLDFVRLASYGKGTESSRAINFTKDIEISLKGAHVLVVEDVVDTGHTMDFLARQLGARGAESFRIAALIDKIERREVPVKVDYAGFRLDSGFIVGYGLDYAEYGRETPAVYIAEVG